MDCVYIVNILDLVLCIPLLWGGYTGFKKGLVVEVISTSSFFIATMSSVQGYRKLAHVVAHQFTITNRFLPYVVFGLIFVVTVVIVQLIGKLLHYLMRPTLFKGVDQLAGSLLGILKWAFCMSALLGLAAMLQLKVPDRYTTHSLFFPIITPLVPKLIDLLSLWKGMLYAWPAILLLPISQK